VQHTRGGILENGSGSESHTAAVRRVHLASDQETSLYLTSLHRVLGIWAHYLHTDTKYRASGHTACTPTQSTGHLGTLPARRHKVLGIWAHCLHADTKHWTSGHTACTPTQSTGYLGTLPARRHKVLGIWAHCLHPDTKYWTSGHTACTPTQSTGHLGTLPARRHKVTIYKNITDTSEKNTQKTTL